MNILDRIREQKKLDVAAAKAIVSEAQLVEVAAERAPARGFARAIRGGRSPLEPRAAGRAPRLIAEVKKASPSAGVIREDFDPVAIARAYKAGGAAAISCLTDETFFQGSLNFLKRIRKAVWLPILRKEFIIDPYQVWEARAAGADAILLIAGFIDWGLLRELRETAREAALDVLMEIHAAGELEPALALAPEVLGINNRDLRAEPMTTRLETTAQLAPHVPPCLPLVSESGIRSREDVQMLADLGIDAILVGEHLMRERDPGAAIAQRLGIFTK